ncbi:hypothetical protein SDC9_166646 [bioreactor metagenome]|uniref:Uncharacterized protein n=1 Tax=bioreactor metagenome TaxID=1076179 RepID=A0A645G087_9ZZZZ
MLFSGGIGFARHGDIDGFGFQFQVDGKFGKLCLLFLDRARDIFPYLVGKLADQRPLGLGKGTHLS